MTQEAIVNIGGRVEDLPPEIHEEYLRYANLTCNSIHAMTFPETGLPADQLHYYTEDGKPTEKTHRIDKTSPTNIGFLLACEGAAAAMGFITYSAAVQNIDMTLTTIEKMIADPEVFIPTNGGKGLFVNWIQPSTSKVLRQWPDISSPVKQQLSTVDNAWFIAFIQLIGVQFPEFSHRINSCLDRVDLPFMFDDQTGFFRGCYLLTPPGFESWSYDVLSEARIAYLVCNESVAEFMCNLINHRSERSVFTDSMGHPGRATWDGGWFELGWPGILVPEGELNEQWDQTVAATIQKQKEYGIEHNGGHYGYSAGLGPDSQYHEFRVPETGECTASYEPQSVVTVSALVNMGLKEPIETHRALQRLHWEFPDLIHVNNGDGDTVDTKTRVVQRDQLFANQAASLLTCWNIVQQKEPQNLFMRVVPPTIKDVYRRNALW